MSTREEDREFLRYRESGDPRAMARVFDLTASRLLLLAMHLVRDGDEAEDLVQTTFLQAIQDADSYQGSGSLLSWLMGILTHRAKDAQRRQARRRERPAATSLDLDQDHRLSPLEELQGRDTLEQVRRVLDAMPQPYRFVLVLRLVHGLKAVEIAHSLDRSPESVRTQLRRGLKMLRDRLPRSLVVPSMFALFAGEGLAAVKTSVVKAAASKGAAMASAGGSVAGVAWITGALLMTTKAKLTTIAVGCAALLVTLWALQEPSSDSGIPHRAPQDSSGGRLVAEGTPGKHEAGTAAAAVTPSERTEVSLASKSKLGSVLVHAIWASDKKPAADVLLRTMYAGRYRSEDPLFDDRSAFTDDKGMLRITDLKPGPLFVQSYRGDADGGQKVAHIKAGQEATIQIVVPIGLDLRGIVVDQSGRPVAKASILVAPHAGWTQGRAAELARSDVDGFFRLRDLAAVRYGPAFVGARARGHAPSVLSRVHGKAGDRHQLRIVLGGRGGGVLGRVVDPRGQPVPSAIVQVGEDKPDPKVLWPGSTTPRRPMPVRVRTDEDGQFTVIGAVPGKQPIAVRAMGLAPWFGTVSVPTDGERELVVHLLSPATLSGTVHDGDGNPLEKVLVSAVSGHNLLFGDRWMRTRPDGKYRLEDLAPGKLKVHAIAQEGRTETELVAVAGQTLQWNPVLARGLVLRGRLVDEQDKPVQMRFSASLWNPGKDRWWRHPQTDKEGRFAIKGCLPDRLITINVQSPPYATRRIVVKPDQRDLVIHLQSLGKPSVFFTGQVLDPDGKPLEGSEIRPYTRQQSTSSKLITDADAGRFKLGPYPPGEYRVFIEAKGYPRVRTAWRKLNKDDTWNLGVIRLQRPGFLQASLQGEMGLLPEDSAFLVQDAAKKTFDHVRIRNGKADRSNPLAAGTYYLEVFGKNCLYALHKFEIHAGRDTHLDVRLERGSPVRLEFVIHTKERSVQFPERVTVEIKDRTGRLILTRAASWVRHDELLRVLEFAARPGKYRVTATSETGKRAEAALTVGDKPAVPQRIVLR